jgi:type II secretory pathway pseudopilin PulG
MNSFILKKLSRNTDDGFTIIDVIVGILIASIFLLVSLQAMVLAAYSRVKAQESSEGILLIQQDLEEVRFKATTSQLAKTDALCNATTATTGYAQTLKTSLGSYPKTVSINGTKQYTLALTSTPSGVAPYNVLQLKYEATPVGTATKVAELYTEVIPDAAFQCN